MVEIRILVGIYPEKRWSVLAAPRKNRAIGFEIFQIRSIFSKEQCKLHDGTVEHKLKEYA